MSSEIAREYFEFIADAGITKHGGSIQATRELVELCRIEEGKYVLDVGCGVGATPAYLAKEVGCRVMGVDLLDKMVEQSRERAKEEGVEDRTEFRVADARELPFEDNTFDAVISESVNIFFDDKSHAIGEYARVAKPGGCVGMIEVTWLKSPPAEMEESLKDVAYIMPLDARGWEGLMKAAGLVDVVGRTHRMNLSTEAKGRIERYGGWRIVKAVPKSLQMIFRDQRSRRFMKAGLSAVSKDMLEYFGNGVYAGHKG
jgi:ubiquinone/menaquinone biosynthesis C-methylase UbiE